LYYERAVPDDTCIANAIADLYAQYPVYGYRRLTACLKRQGYAVNGKHILRVMRQMGLRAIILALEQQLLINSTTNTLMH
jgi:putative transposase